MPKKKASPSSDRPRYSAKDRYVWMEVRDKDAEDDAPPLLVRIRSELSVAEADGLVFDKDTLTTAVWEKVAPFVIDWNLDDDNGDPIPAPAIGGGEQFRYINNAFFWQVFSYLKLNSGGQVEAKRWSGSLRMEGSDSATTLSVIGSNGMAS